MAKKQIEDATPNSKLASVLDRIEKAYGKNTIVKLSDKPKGHYDVISSGSFGLDLALGIGGYPKGRIVELYGGESSGKTTLTLHAIAEAQKQGGKAAFIDVEHAFDQTYAEALGVNLELLYFVQPDNAEQALEIVNLLADSGEFEIIVVDSVAALVPRAELEGEMGDSRMGVMARLMSQALRKLTGTVSKNNVCLFFINQTREKIGVMFGNPETTTGGNALKFYASIRLQVSKGQQVKDGTEVLASTTKVKVIKNKVAPPFKLAEFQIEFGTGIDRFTEVIDLAVEHHIIEKAGSWFSYGDSKIGQGKEKVKECLGDNPELYEEIESKLRTLFYPSVTE